MKQIFLILITTLLISNSASTQIIDGSLVFKSFYDEDMAFNFIHLTPNLSNNCPEINRRGTYKLDSIVLYPRTKMVFFYNEKGEPEGTDVYSAKNFRSNHYLPETSYRKKYLETGNMIEVTRTSDENGWYFHKTETVFNKQRQPEKIVTSSYTSRHETDTTHAEWNISSIVKLEYNKKGLKSRTIRYHYLGSDAPDNFHISEFEYDSEDRLIMHIGINAETGTPEYLYARDTLHTFYKIDGDFILTYKDYHNKTIVQKHDSDGRMIDYVYLLERDDFYIMYTFKYNDSGYPIAYTKFMTYDDFKTDYQNMKWNFVKEFNVNTDENGNIIEEKTADGETLYSYTYNTELNTSKITAPCWYSWDYMILGMKIYSNNVSEDRIEEAVFHYSSW